MSQPQELFRETKQFVTKISGVIHFFEEALNEITEKTPDSQIEENMEKYTKHFDEAKTMIEESKTYMESFLKMASNQSSYSSTIFFKTKYNFILYKNLNSIPILLKEWNGKSREKTNVSFVSFEQVSDIGS